MFLVICMGDLSEYGTVLYLKQVKVQCGSHNVNQETGLTSSMSSWELVLAREGCFNSEDEALDSGRQRFLRDAELQRIGLR